MLSPMGTNNRCNLLKSVANGHLNVTDLSLVVIGKSSLNA